MCHVASVFYVCECRVYYTSLAGGLSLVLSCLLRMCVVYTSVRE